MNDFVNKGDPPAPQLSESAKAMRTSLEESRRICAIYKHLQEAEKLASESDVRFPLVDMFNFARSIYNTNHTTSRAQWDDYNIFTVQFRELSIRDNPVKGVFSAQMHCQVRRFEEFVDRYDATIIRVSEYSGSLHAYATVKDDYMGWFVISCIYERDHLRRCEDSVFEGVDSLRDLFMIYATLKDWQVDLDAQE